MRLEWLEDIVAVIDTGSLSAAAERRCVTQPAFSRRIRAIEAHLGVELFDRTHKPLTLRPALASNEKKLRHLLSETRETVAAIRRQAQKPERHLVIASQHAIAATLAPEVLERVSRQTPLTVRLRSANRDDCLALMMTGRADLVISYETEAEAAGTEGEFLERLDLGCEELLPVISSDGLDAFLRTLDRGQVPVIAYPGESFLGTLFKDAILPVLQADLDVQRRVETALTLAALEFAAKGIGAAWLPGRLVREALSEGRLASLQGQLPTAQMRMTAFRLNGIHDEVEDLIWKALRPG